MDVGLVLVPVTVTDPFGAPFPGLMKESFQLLEDGIEQRIRYLSSDDAPISLGIVFDASRSMEGRMDQSRAAITRFFRTSVRGDEFFLIAFNDAPRLLCNFTGDTVEIEKSLAGIEPRNWTALLDAVCMAIHQMKRARNSRRALLILSDGGDNNSRYTEEELKRMIREADVCIYSIGLFGTRLIRHHERLLRQLSAETGGRFRQVEKIADLPDAVQELSNAIRNQYLLGYSPSNTASDGLYRRIEIRLKPVPGLPVLRASWRTGYYAPAGW